LSFATTCRADFVQCAVKIVPRYESASRREEPRTAEEAEKLRQKDENKEVRTIREAAISLLLHHPYICGMREFITHPHHHYMVFEFIDGGQMLDYIISHGRLRERAARKFARQIGSALDYCHRNSIVHRDLKIENILISKNGNIKIIDFGLSNLYAPDRHLSTFCGSLYFAAPELLNAKPYTGPEVDIWSFGIVLYVLVCGKVPFDDQSMPALHAKIKRGLVEYPAWLSNECKSLLSRMLVTNPTERATLTEVLNHPFIVKGYDGPPDSHLIHREPLRADDLEWDIINAMGGFTFGTPEQIYEELRTVLTSEAYIATLAAWEARRDKRKHPGASTSSTALSEGSDSPKKKRFSAFDLKRILKKEDKKPEEPAVREKELPDPTRGFDPLISIYYLAKEKTEREKVFGRGHFASSQTSLERPAGGYGMPIPSLPVPGPSHAMGYDAPTRNDFAPMPRERAGDVPNPVMQHPSADRETTNIADVPTAHRRGPSLSQPPLPSASLQPSPIDKDHDGLAKRFGLLGRRRPSSSQRSPSASKPEVVTPSPSMPMDHRRTATASDKRHERRTSVGSITNTVGRVARRPSARQAPASPAREGGVLRSPREVDEDAERQLGRESIRPVSPAVDDLDGDDSAGEVKPVYLKGLFSVSTTSSKPAKVLYKEISGALDRLMVKYRPIKGGFECVYVPSIDLASVVNGEEATTSLGELNSPAGISGGATGGITNAPLSSPSGAKRRVSIKKKPSRSNLAAGSNGAGTGSRGTSPAPRGGGSSGTFSGGDAPTTPRKDRGEGRDTREGEDDVDAWALSVGGGAGTKMIVRFEIMVVKVSRCGHMASFPELW
jgi:serine/threonine protein kinase